eukprot:m.16042 g.16042  ORF g.16042 m.16042 type:complete len:763 (+) comp5575_c0_seq1:122-2410(+)
MMEANEGGAAWWGPQPTIQGATVSQLLGCSAETAIEKDMLDGAVQRLVSQIDETKGRVYETLNKHYEEFQHHLQFSEGTLTNEVKALVTEINEIKTQVKEGNLAKIVESIDEQRKLGKELTKTKGIVDVLHKLCEVDGLLSGFDDDIERGQFFTAAKSLSRVEEMLDKIKPSKDEESCDNKIYGVVREDFRRKRSKEKSFLDDMWRRAVTWTRVHTEETGAGVSIAKSVEASHGRIDAILDDIVLAMSSLGMLDQKLAAFSKNVLKVMVEPFCADSNLEVKVKAGANVVSISLAKSATVTKKGKGKKRNETNICKRVLNNCHTLLTFIFEHINLIDAEGLPFISKHLWQGLKDCINDVIAQHIPSKHTQQEQYTEVMEAAKDLESLVVELGIVESSSEIVTKIRDLGVAKVTSSKRAEILENAREIICGNNFNTVEVEQATERGGFLGDEAIDEVSDEDKDLKEAIFRLPKCSISIPTQALVDTAYRNLEEMRGMDPDEAITTFYGVRDSFDLFRAIVPVKNGDALAEVPQICAVFHNDCYYIAHHLLTLGHQFRSSLPEQFQASATFVDMVPYFQDLGEQTFVTFLQSQRRHLLQTLGSVGGLQHTDDEKKFAQVKRAIKQVLLQLGRLSSVWKDCLPDTVHVRSVSVLLDGIFSAMIDEARALEDISEAESHELNFLFNMVKDATLPLFDVSDAKDLPVGIQLPWNRFCQVADIFESRMRDIVEMWKAKEYHLSADEVKGFIKALFENSDKRAASLVQIK